jgi:hypothetical protein
VEEAVASFEVLSWHWPEETKGIPKTSIPVVSFYNKI